MIEIEVPRNSIWEFTKRWKRLAARAARCGVPISYAWKTEEDHPECWVITHREDKEGKKHHYEVRIALIEAPEKIRLGKWSVVGMMEYVEGIYIVHSFDDINRPHLRSLNRIHCDHCFMDRRRTRGFVVRTDDQEERLIGSSCLAEYTGISPGAALFISGFHEAIEKLEDEFFGSSRATAAETSTFMRFAARYVRDFGYRSRKNAEMNGGIATSAAIRYAFFESKKVEWANKITEDEAADLADEVMDWAMEMDPGDSDYLNNVKDILSLGYIPIRLMGIAASSFSAYDRAKGIAAAKKEILSEYVGEVGQRLNLTLTCKRTYDTEGFHGTSTGHFMQDENGRQYTWWSSTGCKIEPGETKAVKATVKAHKEDRDGLKVTHLTRLKVIE